MVTRKVTGVDIYTWTTPMEGVPGQRQYNRAYRGDVIDVDDTEAARGEELGYLDAEDADLPPAFADTRATGHSVEETAMAAGIALPDGSPGPNASTREAGIAAARRQVEAAVSAGAYDLPGDAVSGDTEAAAGFATPTGTVDDDTIRGMKAGELIAYLNQNPGEVDRVDELEGERAEPRTTVVSAIEQVRAAQE